ncbi:MAG: hypothetical protein AAGI69_03590 [Cyanobacteria bacterium P01_H01_bin.21]
MSQSRQPKATAAPSAGTSSEADTMVDAYAEDLMDEVFEDVDRILAGEESAIYAEPGVTSQTSYASLSPAAVTVPAMIVPVEKKAVDTSPQAPITEHAADAQDTQSQKDSTNKRPNRKRLRNFMLGAVCLSALAGAGVWFLRQQPAVVQPADTSAAPTAAPALSEDAAFRDYLTRSLRVISGERSAQSETQNPNTVATTPPTQTTDSQTATGRPANNVIERVFVPLLQPGANQRTPANAVTLPSLPAPNGSGQAANDSAAAVPNIATANTYELVGVLELGDRSAALFEVNGSSQRVYIGETVGGSGWSIVSINNEEVVVRRNGEVRSIYIGQQF